MTAEEKVYGKGTTIIDLTEKITVYATEKAVGNSGVQAGEAIKVHPKVAEKLLANGLATTEPLAETDADTAEGPKRGRPAKKTEGSEE